MRWGRLLAVLVLVAVVGLLAVWMLRERGGDSALDRSDPARPAAPSTLRSAELSGPPTPWLWQRGIDARRIAGQVVHAGRPVAGAAVRLTTEELRVGEWALAEIETDRDGRFDFGPQPPTRYRVVAQAKGLVAGGLVVELRARSARPAPDDLTIELRDCELTISGTVRDAGGGVIAGARVRAASRAEVFGRVLSDDQGRYQICLPAGPAHIEASADGYGTGMQHTGGRRLALVDFALSPEVGISGRVVDQAGKPVAGAVVVAETDGHDPGALVESVADGSFRFEGLGAGSYRVVARADERAAEEMVILNAAESAVELRLVLDARATLDGRALVGGKPLADAAVEVRSSDDKWTLGSAVTRADGRFAIAGLPRGPAQLAVDKHSIVSPGTSIDLAQVSRVELACERLPAVAGRVLLGGKPVARAEIDVYKGWERPYQTVAKEDGTFELDGVAAGSYEVGAVSIPEGATMERRPLVVGAREIRDLVLELDRAGSIAGTVVDSSGAPVGGVTVAFHREDGTAEETSDLTAGDGSFLVGGLTGGDYRPRVLQSSRYGHRVDLPGRERFSTVKVAGGSSRVTGVRLQIDRGRLAIAGRAVRRGEAVAGIDIVASSQADHGEVSAQSGADGTFLIEGLREGRYQLRARSIGGRSITVVAGARDVVFELPASGKIEGVLRGFGVPPRVTISGQDVYREADMTGGRFSVADVAVGTYTVAALAASGAHATEQVTVTADQVSRVTLTAGGTGTLTGVVVDLRTGAPVPGIGCFWMLGDSASAHVTADASGAFTARVPTGKVRVDCFGRRDAITTMREVVVAVEAGATAHVKVEVMTMRHRRSESQVGVDIAGDPSGPPRIGYLHGAGATSGLRVGDLLVAVDGIAVAGMQEYAIIRLMRDRAVGESVRLTVDRDGAQLTFDVPAEPAGERGRPE